MPEEKDRPALPDRELDEQASESRERGDKPEDGDPNPLAPPINIGAGS